MSDEELARRQRWMARGVSTLVVLSVDEDFWAWQVRDGDAVKGKVEDAIAAMLTLCDTERSGPWSSPEGRSYIRRQLERMRQLLSAGDVSDEVRTVARDIVQNVSPEAERWFKSHVEHGE